MPVFISDDQRERFVDCELLKIQGRNILFFLGCGNQELSVLLTDDKKIRELGEERGISEDTAFEWIQEAAAMSLKKQDPSNLMRAAENLIKIFGMEPRKQVITDTMEIDLSRQIEGTIEKEHAKLVAKKEKSGFMEVEEKEDDVQ